MFINLAFSSIFLLMSLLNFSFYIYSRFIIRVINLRFQLTYIYIEGAVGDFNSRLHCEYIYNNISIRKLDVLPIASAFFSILLTFSISK